MFYAYFLKSINHDYYYKGHCEKLEERLKEHNSGMTTFLRPYIPFSICYFEEFANRKESIAREKYFKSSVGRRFLKKALGS
jgi:putative endonuclease